ncbi:hypothetical protein KsCSTR_29280 [Candidatus Kuenenia stuttgartiensis]|uniref:Uncharacterized protein n=1 Tax=Kuenenia stuttgartiensis TaxID=174633 RepID=Q1Q5S9_KUEST|nr:hypothetical protein KsCSTR_29280 [Candidatus Kuenenia stuttgartiensis]CAJ75370.1 unknown protein [Candidatus Kuenenia stuttgartiensis]
MRSCPNRQMFSPCFSKKLKCYSACHFIMCNVPVERYRLQTEPRSAAAESRHPPRT